MNRVYMPDIVRTILYPGNANHEQNNKILSTFKEGEQT